MTLRTENISWGEEDIENVFGFHKATIEGPNASATAHAELRIRFREFMGMLDMALPPGHTKTIVRTKMQEASMFSHFAIAEPQPIVNEPLPDYGDQSHYLVTDAKIDRAEEEAEQWLDNLDVDNVKVLKPGDEGFVEFDLDETPLDKRERENPNYNEF